MFPSIMFGTIAPVESVFLLSKSAEEREHVLGDVERVVLFVYSGEGGPEGKQGNGKKSALHLLRAFFPSTRTSVSGIVASEFHTAVFSFVATTLSFFNLQCLLSSHYTKHNREGTSSQSADGKAIKKEANIRIKQESSSGNLNGSPHVRQVVTAYEPPFSSRQTLGKCGIFVASHILDSFIIISAGMTKNLSLHGCNIEKILGP